MIINDKPSIVLVLKDQIKLINSLDIDARMPWKDKVEFFGLKAYSFKEVPVFDDEEEEEKDEAVTSGGYYDAEHKCVVYDEIDEHLPTILSHELSHHIQHLTCDFNYDTVGQALVYEQQAESISKLLLMKKLFPNDKPTYTPYFDIDDADWVADYFKDQLQDDREEISFIFKRRFF